jgi:sulfur-oxidizing protein SoxY
LIESTGFIKFNPTWVVFLMFITELLKTKLTVSRRVFLRAVVGFVGAVVSDVGFKPDAWAQGGSSGVPLPDERVDATLKRLFGNRPLSPGEEKIKLELPLIAEDGGNVAVTVESSLPVTGATHVNHIYLIADKNRRPMLAKFSFTPDSGRALVSTSIRLATTTDVRSVAEMSDGTLYAVSRHVRVTISGCDLPPQS